MRLMFDNAWIYNKKTSRVYKYCTRLVEVFDEGINSAMVQLGYCCGGRVSLNPDPPFHWFILSLTARSIRSILKFCTATGSPCVQLLETVCTTATKTGTDNHTLPPLPHKDLHSTCTSVICTKPPLIYTPILPNTLILVLCRYIYCQKCFSEFPGDMVAVGDDPMSTSEIAKSVFKEKKNDHVDYEP